MSHRFPCLPPVALSALKRKKRYEKQLQQIDGTLSTIEMQREALEGANTNTAVLQTMGEAAKALKSAHQHMYVPPRCCGGERTGEGRGTAREPARAVRTDGCRTVSWFALQTLQCVCVRNHCLLLSYPWSHPAVYLLGFVRLRFCD